MWFKNLRIYRLTDTMPFKVLVLHEQLAHIAEHIAMNLISHQLPKPEMQIATAFFETAKSTK